MVHVVIFTGTSSIVAVTLSEATLAVVVSGVVMQVTVPVGRGAASERGFLLGGSSLVGG